MRATSATMTFQYSCRWRPDVRIRGYGVCDLGLYIYEADGQPGRAHNMEAGFADMLATGVEHTTGGAVNEPQDSVDIGYISCEGDIRFYVKGKRISGAKAYAYIGVAVREALSYGLDNVEWIREKQQLDAGATATGMVGLGGAGT